MDKKYKLETHSKYGFYRVVPTPSEEEIDKYYKEEFYSVILKNLIIQR